MPTELKPTDEFLDYFAEQEKLPEQTVMDTSEAWFNGRTIDETAFCEEFLRCHKLRCIDGIFFDVDGIVKASVLKSEIHAIIKNVYKSSIASKVDSIFKSLKLECECPPPQPDINKIHVKNGTLTLREVNGKKQFVFSEEKEFCLNRLNVEYVNDGIVRRPNAWRDFLNDLLYDEDIPTLQGYLGYMLIPSTRLQKMLMLIGQGGEGKSRIGVVMNSILGGNVLNASVADLDNTARSRWINSALLHMLALIDDDLDLTALKKTDNLKKTVTAETPLSIERKGEDSFQAILYARLLAFGNGAISSLYDNSDGFYRRQIILQVKPRPSERIDEPNLIDRLLAEKGDIFKWLLQGLERLINNNFKLDISESAKKNLENSRRENNNIEAWLDEDENLEFGEGRFAHTAALHRVYCAWCELNGEFPRGSSSFTRYIKAHMYCYKLEYCENISVNGKRARGFKGIQIKSRNS